MESVRFVQLILPISAIFCRFLQKIAEIGKIG
jgi:hypothetical protein